MYGYKKCITSVYVCIQMCIDVNMSTRITQPKHSYIALQIS